jgi:putative flippase GtrA
MIRIIRAFLDFFYPIVSRIFDKTTYYYAVAGSTNLVLGWVLFWVLDHWVIHSKTVELPLFKHPVHSYTVIAAVCGVVSFLFGFLMMRYVVFTESQLKGRIQFFRYGLSALISATVNWLLIKLMVDTFAWNASLCNVFASLVVVTISYFLQRKFSFK